MGAVLSIDHSAEEKLPNWPEIISTRSGVTEGKPPTEFILLTENPACVMVPAEPLPEIIGGPLSLYTGAVVKEPAGLKFKARAPMEPPAA